MIGTFFDDLTIELVPEVISLGGSWREYDGKVWAYNQQQLGFFHRKVKDRPHTTFFDVGANTGAFSLLAKHIPGLSVYAFEPNWAVCNVLRACVDLNELTDRIYTFNFGLWNKDSVTSLFYPARGESGLGCLGNGGRFTAEIVEQATFTRTIDGMVKNLSLDSLDFIKIDVEGAEKFVLEGAEDTLRRCAPEILMEWWPSHCEHYGYHPSELDKWIYDLGYQQGERVTDTYKYYHKGD